MEGHSISIHPVRKFFYDLNTRDVIFVSFFVNIVRTIKILLVQQDILQHNVEVENFLEATTVKQYILQKGAY